MTIVLDTNILIRHLVGTPEAMAERSTRLLAEGSGLVLVDIVVAEVVYVLESVYRRSRSQVAEAIRSLLSLRSIHTFDPALLLRTIQVYEDDRLDFADAYRVALAESTGIGRVASFDRAIERVPTVERVEP